ncbi:MAG: RDD family protein [Lentisphaeria bacterium]
MEYLVKDQDDNQYGPVNQQNIIDWAKDGRIIPETLIRNTFFSKWRRAEEYDFLKPFISFPKEKNSITTIFSTKTDLKQTSAIATIFRFTPASLTRRSLSWIIDFFIVFSIWLIPFFIVVVNSPKETVLSPYFFTSSMLILSAIYLIYQTAMLGLKAQTLGMYFWGTMIVNADDGSSVLTAKAFLFALLMLPFAIINPYLIYISPGKRSVHELITKTRIIQTRRSVNPKKM